MPDGWRVVRGDTHVLRTAVKGAAAARGLDKLPPVTLAMDLPAHMARDAEHAPEPVAHRIDRGIVEVVLPAWAAPPVPAVAPRTSFASGHFLPVERRESAAP